MRRRLHIFYEAADGGLEVAREVAGIMANEDCLRWDSDEIDRQLDAYAAAVQPTR